MVMLLVILLVEVTVVGLLEILGLPLAAAASEIMSSFRSISTIAGLMTALDVSASRGLHTLWISRDGGGGWPGWRAACSSSSKEPPESELWAYLA